MYLVLAWLPLAATYSGGVSPAAVGRKITLAHVVVSPIATRARVVVYIIYT